jgi:hypothetical protein
MGKSGAMSDQVSFQVELASVKPTRQDFSVGFSQHKNKRSSLA